MNDRVHPVIRLGAPSDDGAIPSAPAMSLYFVLAAYLILLALAVAILIFEIYTLLIAPAKGSPYARTKIRQIEQMFEVAGVKPGELVLDLGSGDGSVLIAAGRRGARAVGVEINPFFVWYSRWRIRRHGLPHLVSIVRADLFAYPVDRADVIFLFLVPDTLRRLSDKFVKEAKPGCRIVSNLFSIPGLIPRAEKDKAFLYQL